MTKDIIIGMFLALIIAEFIAGLFNLKEKSYQAGLKTGRAIRHFIERRNK